MNQADKLPLLKNAFRLLVDNLRGEDRVAIVVYAGAAGVVLPSTTGMDKPKILEARRSLSTASSATKIVSWQRRTSLTIRRTPGSWALGTRSPRSTRSSLWEGLQPRFPRTST